MKTCCVLALSCVAGVALGDAPPPGFYHIGFATPTLRSTVRATSADGSVAVGYYASSGSQGLRWAYPQPPEDVGNQRWLTSISLDGSIFAGYQDRLGRRNGLYSSPTTGLVSIGGLPGSSTGNTVINGLSPDGAVAVGFGTLDFGDDAFLWTPEGGFRILPDLDGGENRAGALGITADKSMIVGRGAVEGGTFAVIWRPDGAGFSRQTLPDLPTGRNECVANAVTHDGLVITGYGSTDDGPQAVRWTPDGEIQILGDLPGGARTSEAFGISSDGSIIVGRGASAAGEEAFIWRGGQMQSLQSYLVGAGVTGLDGWRLTLAWGVSPDGRVFVGEGVNPAGFTEGFMAVVPAPSGLAWLLAGAAFGVLRQRKG